MRNGKKKQQFMSAFMLTCGAVIAAFAIEEFLAPNTIFDGGVTGLSMILEHWLPVKLSFLIILFNIPFLLYGLKNFGKRFIAKAACSMVLFSICLRIFEDLPRITSDGLLATVFGGVFLGFGVGLVLRAGGVLDGTEIVAIMVNKKTNFSVGKTILLINIVIYFIAGLVFGIDRGLYSILMYFISSQLIDLVEVGLDQAKALMIITDEGKEIAEEIYKKTGRTVTFIRGEGLVSQQEKSILYCVITRGEVHELRRLINDMDVNAFITVSDVSEIIGNHMKKVVAQDIIEKKEASS